MINTLVYFKNSGECIGVFSGNIDLEQIYYNLSEEYRSNLGKIIVDYPVEYRNILVVDGEIVEKEYNTPTPQTNPLEERIKELEDIIDIMLGGIEDGI